MRFKIVLVIAAFTSAAFIHTNLKIQVDDPEETRVKVSFYKKYFAIGCSPNLSQIDFTDEANAIPLLEGWGNYRMPVTAANDSANIYFQQGINMYYGFHIIEAMASFERAIGFDKNFAMGYWGKALAAGPNINDVGYTASPDAILAVKKAKELCTNCTAVEKALIDAMGLRYSSDSSITRESLNQLYADAMKKVHDNFPKSGDAAALYADALLVQHPWDLYDRHYKPKPWTPVLVGVLETLIKTFPEHPGASHYYIHTVEGSAQPEKGLEVANKLGQFMPGLSHLVHMPSHIYIRSGFYKKGIDANVDAVNGYKNYLQKYPLVANSAFIYEMHNLHMKAACAAMDGQYSNAMKYAAETKQSIDTLYLDAGGYWSMYSQYLYITPFFTQLRFGKWNDILKEPLMPTKRVYANTMQHFARGLAFARLKNFDNAESELQLMDDSLTSLQMQNHPAAFNAGSDVEKVAELVLKGVIAEEQGKLPPAIELFKKAIDKEDVMLYNEPKDWLLPVRQYLGNALLKAKQYSEAEKVFNEDLKINPNNGWSLTGLQTALQQQGKKSAASFAQQKAKDALVRSDVKITAPVF